MQPIVESTSTRVLIIEDDADLRESLETALTEAGFTVDTADNAEHGLERVMSKKPDVIILDIITSSIHGVAFMQRLRGLPEGQNDSRVVVLTNLEAPHIREKIEQHDISAFLINANTSLEDIVHTVRGSLAMN
jgi:Response regulator containing CheY-like receiver, AAA-type ATPase, and DNA-binding domains